VSFQRLYLWFVIDHGRRRLIHFNVTTNPSARWVIQQLREAFPGASTPRYLWLPRIRSLSNHANLSSALPIQPRDAPAMRQHESDDLRRTR